MQSHGTILAHAQTKCTYVPLSDSNLPASAVSPIGLDKLCSKIQLLCPEAVLVKSTIMLTKKPIMLELCSKKIQFQHAHPLIPGPRARAPGRARVKNTQT